MTIDEFKQNINKFSWQQMLSNNDGKTSLTGTIGSIISLAGVIGFLFGCADFAFMSHKNDIMMFSGGIITLGTSLILGRKLKSSSSVIDETIKLNNSNKENTPDSSQLNS